MVGPDNRIDQYQYDQFGNVVNRTVQGEDLPVGPRFLNRDYDSAAGIYRSGTRMYDPVTRRYLNANTSGSTADGANPYAAATEFRSRIYRAHTSLDLSGSFEGYITDPIRLMVGDSTLSRMSNAEAIGLSLGVSVAIYAGGSALAPFVPQSASAFAWSLGGTSLASYGSVQAGKGALETGVEWGGTRLFGSASDRANFSFLGSFAKNTAINFVTGGFGKIGFAGRQGLEILGDTAYDVGVGGQSLGSSLAMNTVGSLGGELVGWGLQAGAKRLWSRFNVAPVPRGFITHDEFANFGAAIATKMRDNGYQNVVALLQGSSVTGFRARSKPGIPAGTPFDVMKLSDLDVALVGPELLAKATELGIPLRSRGVRTGPLRSGNIRALGLEGIEEALLNTLYQHDGRKINFMIYRSLQDALNRGPSIRIPGT